MHRDFIYAAAEGFDAIGGLAHGGCNYLLNLWW